MTIRALKQEIKSQEELKNVDIQDLYRYQRQMETYYLSKGIYSTFWELSYTEFRKARTLTKWIEENYTAAEEVDYRYSRKPNITSYNDLLCKKV
jgi:hypothetical protein